MSCLPTPTLKPVRISEHYVQVCMNNTNVLRSIHFVCKIVIIFFSSSSCAQKNCGKRTILLSSHIMFWLRIKKIDLIKHSYLEAYVYVKELYHMTLHLGVK